MTKAEFLDQLIEWGYNPNRMLAELWDESGFHTIDPSGPAAAEVNGQEYVASYFQPWKSVEHYNFVASFYESWSA